MNVDLTSHTNSIFFRCVEDCSEPIMISDRSGRLKYVNPAWEATYGYTKEEAVGATPRLIRSLQQDEAFYKKMWSQILDPKLEGWKGEVVNRAKDGRLVPVLLTITPYKLEGETLGYMAIAVDLTERRSMELQILRQDRLASVGMLASSLAHEIGNPLGVIRGRAEIILNTLAMGVSTNVESSVNGLKTIIGQIDRISRLIESLLKLTRVPQEIRLNEVALDPIIQEVSLLIGENLKRKGIEFDNRIEMSKLSVMADGHHLQQILLNLIINGVHAIDEENKRREKSGERKTDQHKIRIGATTSSVGRVTLTVEDSGCGITPEVKKRMFDPFFTTKTPGQGTGLGLAIVQRLVEEMKGCIEVQSEGPGRGAKVSIQLNSSSPASTESAATNP